MQFKILLKWSLIILSVAGIIFFAVIISFFILTSHSRGSSIVKPALFTDSKILQSSITGLPYRLIIPKIGVDAAIEYLGLTSQGAMAVPKGPTDAAWFDLGPRPGDSGSAVIAGHEGWKDGIAAVFDNLYKLRIGDKIYVEDEQGVTTVFVVSGIKIYNQDGNASDVFNSSDGKAHLNLITCEGTWNAAQKSYSNRLVVFADKE